MCMTLLSMPNSVVLSCAASLEIAERENSFREFQIDPRTGARCLKFRFRCCLCGRIQRSLASVEMMSMPRDERQGSRVRCTTVRQALSNFILQTEIAMRLMDVDAGQARETN